MINKLINNLLNQASFNLSDTKDRILTAAKKRAQEEAINNIPSPQDFKQQLEGLVLDSPNALQKAERTYNNFINLVEKAIQKLESLLEELNAIKTRLNDIRLKFDQITEITNIFSDILVIIKTLLPTLDIVLGFSTGLLANGTIINKIGEFKTMFKDKIKNTEGVISGLVLPQKYFMKEINNLEKPLDEGINNVQFAIDQLRALLEQLNLIWGNFILKLDLPELNSDDEGSSGNAQGSSQGGSQNPLGDPSKVTADTIRRRRKRNKKRRMGKGKFGGITLKEYLKDPDNLKTVVTEVIIPTYKVRYEIREEGPGTQLRESGIREVPIN